MSQRYAFVFPGQGAQAVGMGQDFVQASPKAKHIFDLFDAAIAVAKPGISRISDICFNGPEDSLKQTLYTQPAILATSLAALALFQERCQIQPTVAAGHSLGEYGALVTANVFDIETAAKLIIKRASLMQEAPPGAMSAVLGLAQEKLESVITQIQAENPNLTIAVANFNTPDQIVITGSPELLESSAPRLKEAGAKRVLPLPVGGAFHSPLMHPSANAFEEFLKNIVFENASIPVITNLDAEATMPSAELKIKLSQQIDHSVCWTQTMDKIVNDLGITTIIEFGPGKVLTGMFKKTHPLVTIYNVFDMASLEQTVDALSAVPA